ncbi:hypothetical protein O1611_g7725 [Lasiodiplodia mahajangana]|uniref:Uncharacterized protein n=1 Tax=Lasiodiplodia mahajangana TaxID=1108764 RepID=A0ACC2JEF2_9PEZI|nr:hypothetical protein O1611_g7725 [Lasiodiplodia mahajangana]
MASSLGIWENSWGYIAATIFLAFLASLLVALRFWSRWISAQGIHSDDWLALATLFVQHGLGAIILVGFISYGLGFSTKSLETADAHAAKQLQKLTFIGTILYGTGSTSIRLSVIIFYFRIFATKIVRRGCYVLAGICLAWFVAIEALNLATCRPISFMWDKGRGGYCVKTPAGIIVLGAFNVVIDAATVVLPIREVIKLKLSREKKLIIFGVFLIGGIATLSSLARLVLLALYLNPETDGGTGATSAMLSATTGFEVYIAIIAACAPTLVPLYKKLRRRAARSDSPIPHRSGYTTKPPKKQAHTYAKGGTNTSFSRTALRESDDEERPFKRFDDVHVLVPAKERGELWTNITARPGSEGIQLKGIKGIRVQRDVTWNSEE